MKNDSAWAGLKPFLQTGTDSALTVLPWPSPKSTGGRDRDGLEWHRGHTQIPLIPAASPGRMHWTLKSSLASFPHLQGEQESCRRKQLGSFHFALCHSSPTVQHKTFPTAPRTPPLPAPSRQGRCRLYSQDLMAVGEWYQEHDGEHGKQEDREPKSLLSWLCCAGAEPQMGNSHTCPKKCEVGISISPSQK